MKGVYTETCDCPTCSILKLIHAAVIELKMEPDKITARHEITVPMVELCRIADTMRAYETFINNVAVVAMAGNDIVPRMMREMGISLETATGEMRDLFVTEVIKSLNEMKIYLNEYEGKYKNGDKKKFLKSIGDTFGVKL